MADRIDLNRSTVDVRAEGRTLVGVAVPFDTVATVRDRANGPQYLEAFAPASADQSIARHRTFPTFIGHDPSTEPVGVTTFERSDAERALLFTSPLSKTHRADETLELVNDGAYRSVSISFRPVRDARRTFPEGVATYRTEVALRHLALAPTGYGQYEGAQVAAVRAMMLDNVLALDPDDDPATLAQALDAILDAALKCLTPDDDDYNPAQALALLQGADPVSDKLLAVFGAPDADDEPDMVPRAAIVHLQDRRRALAARLPMLVP